MAYETTWSKDLYSYIWIFAVERGFASFIKTGLNQGIMYDCGSSESFSPTAQIKDYILPPLNVYEGRKIAQLVLSHPHCDHISEIEAFRQEDMHPFLITCPHNRPPEEGPEERINTHRINNPEHGKGVFEEYLGQIQERNLPLRTIQYKQSRMVPDLEYGIYYIRPPICEGIHPENDQDYTNSLSLLLYYRHGRNAILFTGDVTPSAIDHILNKGDGVEKRYTVFSRAYSFGYDTHRTSAGVRDLTDLLTERGLTVLVAPHHGLESGYPSALFEVLKPKQPRLVVISDRVATGARTGKTHDDYGNEAWVEGTQVNINGSTEFRRVLSTKKGHHILIIFTGQGYSIFADSNFDNLSR